MSAVSATVTPAHFAYIAAHTAPEDPFLQELKREAVAAGIPAIWIAPEQAVFLQILLRLARAQEVVEVGTLAGVSAIALARALPPAGRVRTLEIDPSFAVMDGRPCLHPRHTAAAGRSASRNRYCELALLRNPT